MDNTANHPQGIKTIRLSQRELAVVLEEIERHSSSETVAQLRCEPRHSLANAAPVLVRVAHPGGSLVELVVKAGNLSSRGIGFINGAYLYAGTPVTVFLRRIDGNMQGVCGTVKRCQHVRGVIHDVGVQFDKPIELRHFLVDAGDGPAAAVPKAILPQFDGAALYIDSSPDDRDLMGFVLGRLGLTVETAGSAEQGIESSMKKMFDLILVDLRLKDTDPRSLVEGFRKRNYPGPIVAVSMGESVEEESKAIEMGFSYLLPKPLRQREAAAMAERYLRRRLQGSAEANKPLMSQFWSDVDMRPLILRFLGRLEQSVGKMTRHLADQNLTGLEQVCTDMVSAAAGYGYPQIHELLAAMRILCGVKAEASQLSRTLEELIKLCDSALQVRRAVNAK